LAEKKKRTADKTAPKKKKTNHASRKSGTSGSVKKTTKRNAPSKAEKPKLIEVAEDPTRTPSRAPASDYPEEGATTSKASTHVEMRGRDERDRNLIDRMIAEDEGEIEEAPPDPAALDRGDNPMTLVGHLSEMRSRLLVALGAILVVMLVAFGFSDYLLALITKPFTASGQKLNLFTLFEGFTLRLKASLFASVLLCLPLVIYQVWKYVEPAVNRNDRNVVRLSLGSAVLLFYAGTSFTYLFLPVAIIALMAFAPPEMLITNNATEYFNFFVMTAVILGAVFELPIVMLLLTKMGIVSPAFLTSKRKYAIVVIWIIAALASPGPDPLSQAILALPLMFLYELSILISKIIVRRKKKKELAERG